MGINDVINKLSINNTRAKSVDGFGLILQLYRGGQFY
jgi:hypothetical protein